MSGNENKDFEVGYGRPPKKHQFKKGQSGNPKGRPKSKGSVELNIDTVLPATVRTKVNKEVQEMDTREANLRVHLKAALGGKLRAAKYILDQFEKNEAIVAPKSEILSGVVVAPTSLMPFRLASMAVNAHGRPPWTKRQLKPLKKHYLATRTDQERIEDEQMGYDL